MPSAAIETRALTKRYGAQRGIEEIDLVVLPGEVFGFLGPNGAGKTTTIRVLLDELRPTSGSASVLGLDSHVDATALHGRIGYLPGDLALYERLTGAAHLDWLARLRGDPHPVDRERLVERFEVELDRPIHDLSKGNRQKIGLVQAFMHRPELVILDEPTTGLDPLMQDEFQQLLRELTDDGCTIFLSSHSLDEVQHVADRVGIIREGRLVTVQTVEDLEAAAVHRVEIRFAETVAPEEFVGLPGVRDLVIDQDPAGTGSRLRFSLAGDPDPVVKAAAAHTVTDLVSQHADLEEIFLTFYRGAIDDAHPDADRPVDPGAVHVG
jgi:ABC-2 type transport system ATP-binding protein